MNLVSWKPAVVVGGMVLAAYLSSELASLLLPLTVSSLLAYVCRPLVARLERHYVPRGVAIVLVLSGFLALCFVIIVGVRAAIPTEHRFIAMKVHALYALNDRYEALMGLDRAPTKGNRLYRLVRSEADQLMDRTQQLLALTAEERADFLASRDTEPAFDRLLREYQANLRAYGLRTRTLPSDGEPSPRTDQARGQGGTKTVRSPLTVLGNLLSTWIVMPLVFFFLLRDTGDVKRGLFKLIPNGLFEPALCVLSDLDRAVGDYLRGLSLSCCFLGLTITLFFALIGMPLCWAVVIGSFAAMTNVVPYLGSIVALLGGLAYAFFGEEFHKILPMVEKQTFMISVIVAVVLADLLKNAVYDPIVLGGAIRLHPLVIIIGFACGTLMFGIVGAILAIPTITVCTVFTSSTARHLKAYRLI